MEKSRRGRPPKRGDLEVLKAITRDVSPAINNCELTHLARVEIDLDRARAQHHAYRQALGDADCQVVELAAEPELPDSVFVEDAAIVLDEVAVIARPGAESRRPETASLAQVLRPYRDLLMVQAPATLEGGDVLQVGGTLYVGKSGRSNPDGLAQLTALTACFGYLVRPVEFQGCLHLKSAVTRVGPEALLFNPQWTSAAAFPGFELIPVDPREPYGANALWLGGRVLYPLSFPRTRERLERRGIGITPLDLSELQKAEGALTCCSLIFEEEGASGGAR
jgi:dimethylargininase